MKYTIHINRNIESPMYDDGTFHIPFSRKSKVYTTVNNFLKYRGYTQATDEHIDLLEFGVAIYYLDKYCPRSERENWIRSFHVKMSLRNPDAFQKINSNIVTALQTLCGDNFTFAISKYEGFIPSKSIAPRESENKIQPTCIALLSGGMDSVAGGLHLTGANEVPLFLRVNTHDRINIGKIYSGIKKNGNCYLAKMGIAALKTNGITLKKEPSQRARSFFFLTCAAFLSATWDLEKIFINENGIMGIHIPLDPSRASTFSTRTVYPPFVSLFQEIIRSWLNKKVVIENLFESKTKAEVLEEFNKYNRLDLIKNTISCAHAANFQQVRRSMPERFTHIRDSDSHCGYCFPCILRRISVSASGFEEHDIKYGVDAFNTIYIPNSKKNNIDFEASSAIIGLLRFADDYNVTADDEKVFKYLQILESSPFVKGGAQAIIHFHNLFVNEVFEYLMKYYPNLMNQIKINQKSTEILKKTLSENNFYFITNQLAEKHSKGAEKEIPKAISELKWDIQRLSAHTNFDEGKTNLILTQKLKKWLKLGKDQKLKNITQKQIREIKKSAEDDECECPLVKDFID